MMAKNRNTIMALCAHSDPGRFRTRTVETEKAKVQKNRARRKADLRREMAQNYQ